MDNFIKMDLSDAEIATGRVIPAGTDDLVGIEVWNVSKGLSLIISEQLFQEIHDKICRDFEVPTYGELEEAASNLRDKLMDLKDKYEELKEAYEELKRR